MAISNRDRIGQMLELFAPAAERFVAATIGSDPKFADWTKLIAVKDAKNGVTGKKYSTTDPQLLLRMLTENIPHQVVPGWYPFDEKLSKVHKSYASELRDARDAWAHNAPFSDDDAYRVLDTAERLLKAMGEGQAADEVGKIRLNLRRVTSAKADERTLKSAVTNPEAKGLQPWREVLQPHDDVATGNFQAAEFAADLYKVAHSDEASRDYSDPVQFLARTYLTEGLRDLVTRAVRRLAGDDNASPVINLQTNFGGGKTHSMLALWHLGAGMPVGDLPQDIQDLLVATHYGDIASGVNRVALVGNHLSTTGSTKADGTHVNTLWGELAWQLGGRAAYDIVAASDAKRTPPGDALHTLLAAYSPALILIDEWVAYARSLVGRDDLAAGTFDDQFTFAQSLTEAVKGTRGVLLAISIPASESGDDSQVAAGNAEEVGGAHGLEALRRLQNVVRRVADQWRPASSDEAYHIVRQRLFTSPDAQALASIGATARGYVEMYRKHSGDFPRESHDPAYEERIKRTYPIHPELFDRLYEDWSSLERFQRTRGVLRLMNKIIHALWVGEDQSPLIMPGSLPIATADVNAELTQYLQDNWKAVIDADVDGANSEPARIDTEKPLFGQRSLTKRLARTVFFGSAPRLGAAHKGLETQRVFLGAAVPGDVPGNFHSALTQLGDRATYVYSGSGKWWYDLQANISRRAKDHADRLHEEEVWAEIVRRLEAQRQRPGDFAGVHVCPVENGDVPDLDEARLVVLHPRYVHKKGVADSTAMVFAKAAVEHRGTANRTYRNMLVFLAADADRMAELDTAVRDYLGWKEVLDKKNDLDLTGNQVEQAQSRMTQADATSSSRLAITYHWALVPDGQPITMGARKIEGQSGSLAEIVSKRLGSDGTLATRQGIALVRLQLDGVAAPLWSGGHLTVGDLWQLYAQYAYMPRLRNRAVLDEALRSATLMWQAEGVALADSYDASAQRYRGLAAPPGAGAVITDATLVVKPTIALEQIEQETAAVAAEGPAKEGEAGQPPATGREGGVASEGKVATPPPGKTRFFGSKTLAPGKHAVDFKKINDEILTHLAGPGTELTVRIEIDAVNPAGFDDAKIRTVSENASTLKFEQSGFEME